MYLIPGGSAITKDYIGKTFVALNDPVIVGYVTFNNLIITFKDASTVNIDGFYYAINTGSAPRAMSINRSITVKDMKQHCNILLVPYSDQSIHGMITYNRINVTPTNCSISISNTWILQTVINNKICTIGIDTSYVASDNGTVIFDHELAKNIEKIEGFTMIKLYRNEGVLYYNDIPVHFTGNDSALINVEYNDQEVSFKSSDVTTVTYPYYVDITLKDDEHYDGETIFNVHKFTVKNSCFIHNTQIVTDKEITLTCDEYDHIKYLDESYDANNLQIITINDDIVNVTRYDSSFRIWQDWNSYTVKDSLIFFANNTGSTAHISFADPTEYTFLYIKGTATVSATNASSPYNILVQPTNFSGYFYSKEGSLTPTLNGMSLSGETFFTDGQVVAAEFIPLTDDNGQAILIDGNEVEDARKKKGYIPIMDKIPFYNDVLDYSPYDFDNKEFFWERDTVLWDKPVTVITESLDDMRTTDLNEISMPHRIYRAYFKALSQDQDKYKKSRSVYERHNYALRTIHAQHSYEDYVKQFCLKVKQIYYKLYVQAAQQGNSRYLFNISQGALTTEFGYKALKELANIDVTNNDCGVIWGLDAGGSSINVPRGSVIAEPDFDINTTYPQQQYNNTSARYAIIKGLTFTFPDPDKLSEMQQRIVAILANYYYEAILDTLEFVFGASLNFSDNPNFTGVIETIFKNIGHGFAASCAFEGGKIITTIDDQYFSVDFSQLQNQIIDTTILHEMAHSYQQINLGKNETLGTWFIEGGAEFSSAGADMRFSSYPSDVYSYIRFYLALMTNKYNNDPSQCINPYIHGYIFLRWYFQTLAEERGWVHPKIQETLTYIDTPVDYSNFVYPFPDNLSFAP